MENDLQQRLTVLRSEVPCCEDLPGLRSDAEEALEGAQVFEALKAVSSRPRALILEMVRRRPDLCACELQAALGVSHGTVSHHMRALEDAGLVGGSRRGRWVHYRLTDRGGHLLAALRRDR